MRSRLSVFLNHPASSSGSQSTVLRSFAVTSLHVDLFYISLLGTHTPSNWRLLSFFNFGKLLAIYSSGIASSLALLLSSLGLASSLPCASLYLLGSRAEFWALSSDLSSDPLASSSAGSAGQSCASQRFLSLYTFCLNNGSLEILLKPAVLYLFFPFGTALFFRYEFCYFS